ncbi:MAG: 3'(2'),5'-bisphosphate nucleotidase CysQ [Rhodomicrobium sp.]
MTFAAADYKDFALSVMAAAQRAGAAIMDIYGPGMDVRYKADRSPVTDADQASEDILIAALSELMPDVPAIAEERAAANNLPSTGSTYFAVDPLDGTKEFLKLNGEFCINVGLIDAGKAVFGLLFAPAKADCFVTLGRGEAYRCELHPAHNPPRQQSFDFTPLRGEAAGRPFTAIVSRSHIRPETVAFLDSRGNPERMTMGSAMKFGMLAAGEADVYPRHGPTNEWDTAAGQAILEAAGGCVLTLDGKPLLYGKKDQNFLNPPFIAWRRPPGTLS